MSLIPRIAALLLVTAALIAPAAADPLSTVNGQITDADLSFDRNGSGDLDREEWGAKGEAAFADFDLNHDGAISADEFREVHASGFTVADADGDGRLSGDEVD